MLVFNHEPRGDPDRVPAPPSGANRPRHRSPADRQMSTERHSRRTSGDRGILVPRLWRPSSRVLPTLRTQESGLPVQGEDRACRSLYAAAKEEVGTTDAGRLPGREPGFAPGPSQQWGDHRALRGSQVPCAPRFLTENTSNVASQRPPDQRFTGLCAYAAPLEHERRGGRWKPRIPPHALAWETIKREPFFR